MKQFFTFIAVLGTLMAKAQPDPIGNFNKHVIEKWTHDYIRVSQYRVKGSPYLLGDSFSGDITMKSGVVTVDKKILYDIYDQKVGFDLDKKFVAPDGEVSGFFIQLTENFGGEKLIFINAANLPKVNLKGYLNVGASICSEPGVDPLFNTVDYLTILKMTDMNSKYVKRFLR
jgi:hypothetical protein